MKSYNYQFTQLQVDVLRVVLALVGGSRTESYRGVASSISEMILCDSTRSSQHGGIILDSLEGDLFFSNSDLASQILRPSNEDIPKEWI